MTCRLREVVPLLYFKKKGELVTGGRWNDLATITGPSPYLAYSHSLRGSRSITSLGCVCVCECVCVFVCDFVCVRVTRFNVFTH